MNIFAISTTVAPLRSSRARSVPRRRARIFSSECTKGQSGVKGMQGCSCVANAVSEPSGQQLPGKLLAIAFSRRNHREAVSYRNSAGRPPLPGTTAHHDGEGAAGSGWSPPIRATISLKSSIPRVRANGPENLHLCLVPCGANRAVREAFQIDPCAGDVRAPVHVPEYEHGASPCLSANVTSLSASCLQ